MIVQTPDTQSFGAAVVSGWTQGGSSETLKNAVILKAAYDLVQDGSNPRVMVPTDDETRVEIIFADAGFEFDQDGSTALDVTYEADIALEKTRADIVVQGFMPDGTNPVDGSVLVNGSQWLVRSAVVRSRDTERNLFGFQPRMEFSRKISVDENFVPDEGNLLPPAYNSSFNNFHRNGGDITFGFFTLGVQLAAELPSGGLVELHQTTDQSDTAYSFRLPVFDLTARYRVYCGHGPDEAPSWRIGPIGPMRPDTLIVAPDSNRATIVWRASWDTDAEAADIYRKIQILRGGA